MNLNPISLESLADRFERGETLSREELTRLYLNGQCELSPEGQRRVKLTYQRATGKVGTPALKVHT
jgi:hypothetical protein